MNSTINIILADDDKDDCLLFKDAVEELHLPVQLTTVHDGDELMQHLEVISKNLPYALFLDLNMPRKNGFECLTEIKKNSDFNKIPVIIYSTSYDQEKANIIYNEGAHYYICKPSDFEELKNMIHKAIMLLGKNNLQASKENFYINKVKFVL
ncbi:MAG: response regulator [Ferruginibacter sp.]|nr:response regulator [Ferruginibacter sp.]